MKFFRNPLIAYLSVTLLMMSLFVIGSWRVVAQTFIPPSSQAPRNNVIDFINQSGGTQSRSGVLQINVPNYQTAILGTPEVLSVNASTVPGNAYIQGPVIFAQNTANNSALEVNPSVSKPYVTSGATGANGKYSVAATNTGLYGQTSVGHAIFGKTYVASVAVFGKTLQVPTGSSVSYGLWAKTTGNTTNNVAIYAQNNGTCSAGSFCKLAAQFIGNFVVNGKLWGDARGIYKAWTLNDANDTSSGIAFKTIDLSAPGFPFVIDGSDANVLKWSAQELDTANETFVSMSVLVDGALYNPVNATLATSDVNYLSVTFTQPTTLTVKKNKDSTASAIVIQMFYHKKVDISISPSIKNVLVGSNGTGSVLFSGLIAGGASSNSEFVWELYKDSALTLPCDATCGTMDATTMGLYNPPAAIGAINPVFIKATWVYDSTISAYATVNLYSLTITQAPASGIIGSASPLTIQATVQGPGSTPTIAWALLTSYGASITPACSTSLTCSYVAPGTMAGAPTPPPWSDVVQVRITGISDTFTTTASVKIIPTVTIQATNPATGTTYSQSSSQNTVAEVGIGQTLTLYAVANNVPALYSHNFTWVSPTSDSIAPGATDGTTQTTTFTAPNTTITPRQARATWSFDALALMTLYVAQGDAQNITMSRGVSTSGVHAVTIAGYATRILALQSSPTVPLIANQTVSSACGTLIFNSYTPALDTCDPKVSQCSRTANFTYTASGSACSANVSLVSVQDPRDIATITMQSTVVIPSCYCTKKPFCAPEICGGGGTDTPPGGF